MLLAANTPPEIEDPSIVETNKEPARASFFNFESKKLAKKKLKMEIATRREKALAKLRTKKQQKQQEQQQAQDIKDMQAQMEQDAYEAQFAQDWIEAQSVLDRPRR